MVGELDTELKKSKDTIAQYLTIPRDIVRDEGYPFDRNAELQLVTVKIDFDNKVLIVRKKEVSQK